MRLFKCQLEFSVSCNGQQLSGGSGPAELKSGRPQPGDQSDNICIPECTWPGRVVVRSLQQGLRGFRRQRPRDGRSDKEHGDADTDREWTAQRFHGFQSVPNGNEVASRRSKCAKRQESTHPGCQVLHLATVYWNVLYFGSCIGHSVIVHVLSEFRLRMIFIFVGNICGKCFFVKSSDREH